MVANKIRYFFESNAIKEAFESCICVIQQEINMNQLFELNRICEISDQSIEEIEQNDWEETLLVETSNLKEYVEFFIEEFNIDVRSLFLSDDEIKKRLEEIITRIKEEERNKFDFSISIEKSSDLETLFNVIYSRSIDQNEDYEFLEYEDFEYQAFFDAIDSIVSENNEIESFEFDHTGGETIDNIDHLDLYYNFKLKEPNKIIKYTDLNDKERKEKVQWQSPFLSLSEAEQMLKEKGIKFKEVFAVEIKEKEDWMDGD